MNLLFYLFISLIGLSLCDFASSATECSLKSGDSCLQIKIDKKNYGCCSRYKLIKIDGVNDEIEEKLLCTPFIDLKEKGKKIAEELGEIEREHEGYTYGGERYYDINYNRIHYYEKLLSEKVIYNCPNNPQEYSIKVDYNENEKRILTNTSNRHCLYYSHTSSDDITKEICQNAGLLESTKNVGVYCSLFEATVKYDDKNEETIKACGLFSPTMVKNGHLDEYSNDIINNLKYIADKKGTVSKFEVEVSNEKGNGFKYDYSKGISSGNGSYINNKLLTKLLLISMIFLVVF